MNPRRSRKSGGQKGSHLIMILSESVRICVNFKTWLSPGETPTTICSDLFRKRAHEHKENAKLCPPHMKPDLHWSLRQCRSLFAGSSCQSPPPSSGSPTCKVWSYDGKTCDLAGCSGCACSSPIADEGFGYPERRMNNS